MKNWKTTVLGVATIVATVANAVVALLKTGQMPDLLTTSAAITAGWGLIAAKDNTARL